MPVFAFVYPPSLTRQKQNSRSVTPRLFCLCDVAYFTMTQPLSNSMVPL